MTNTPLRFILSTELWSIVRFLSLQPIIRDHEYYVQLGMILTLLLTRQTEGTLQRVRDDTLALYMNV